MNRDSRKTVPVPVIRDDEISQEIALRKPDSGLNEKHVFVAGYAWGDAPALARTRTEPLPPSWVAPVL